MKKNIPVIITFLSVVVAAGGISFGIKASNQKSIAMAEAQALRDQLAEKGKGGKPVADTDSTPVVALKDISSVDTNDVAALQEQLSARDAELARLQAEAEARRNRQPRQSFQDRMAQMKEEDPEGYAEMVQRRTERQEQMRYDQANRLTTFMSMDTSTMSPEELENHNQLVDKLTALWEITGEFDPEQPPDREAMRDIFQQIGDVRPLMEQERTVMLKQLGNEVGLSGSDTEDFATYVQDIYSATSLRFPGGSRGGGRDRGNNGGDGAPAGTVQ